MKAEVIGEIARKGARHEGEYMNASAIIDMALPILKKAGFVVLPKEELEAALKPFAKAATMAAWPTAERDATAVDDSFGLICGDLRRAAALLAAITQETKNG